MTRDTGITKGRENTPVHRITVRWSDGKIDAGRTEGENHMATTITGRLGEIARSYTGMDPKIIAAARDRFALAVYDAKPTADVQSARDDINANANRVRDLAIKVGLGADLERIIIEASTLVDIDNLLTMAGEDNRLARLGGTPNGGGSVPMDLYADARHFERLARSGAMTRSEARSDLAKSIGKFEKLSLGRWEAAKRAVQTCYAEAFEDVEAAGLRLQSREMAGEISMLDHQARLRVRGADPSQALEAAMTTVMEKHATDLDALKQAMVTLAQAVAVMAGQQAQAQANQNNVFTVKP
jgi:hypothetical protein